MAVLAVNANETTRTSNRVQKALSFAVIYLAWGATFVAIRVAVGVVPPFLAAAIRFLTAGLLLWVGYGLLKGDWVIVAANSVGATLSASVLVFKIRDLKSGR